MTTMQVHTTKASSYASSCYPGIHADMQKQLTGYGLSMLHKQMVAGANYGAALHTDDDACSDERDERAFPNADPDIVDAPRYLAASDLQAAISDQHNVDVRMFTVKILHTVTDKPTNPHFVILYDKIQDHEAYKSHMCTCASSIRCGVPCRHFWAVLRATTSAAFHGGLINDLWFRTAQTLSLAPIKVHTYDKPGSPIIETLYKRPLYPFLLSNTDNEESIPHDLMAKNLTNKRLWGTLLGEAKLAIERAIATKSHDGLYSTLKGFSAGCLGAMETGDIAIAAVVRNPAVVQGKGRPKNAPNRGNDTQAGSKRPAPRHRQPLGTPDQNAASQMGGEEGSVPTASEEGNTANTIASTKKPRTRQCGNCGLSGHNSRSCPTTVAGSAK